MDLKASQCLNRQHLVTFGRGQHDAREHGALVGGREGEQRLVAALLDLLAADDEDLRGDELPSLSAMLSRSIALSFSG